MIQSIKTPLFSSLFALGFVMASQGVVVFADDFESGANPYGGTTPDVTTYTVANTSKSRNASIWVGTTNGFGSDRQGLIDGGTGGTDFGNFTPDSAGPQAYAFRYTNSGLTSASGVIGSLAVGQTITVTFDVFIDGYNTGTAYSAYLTTFDGGVRTDMVGGAGFGTTSILAQATGSAASGAYQSVSFSYTVGNDVIDANGAGAGTSTTFDSAVMGQDIAIRFHGATNYANIDNVSVDITSIPEPAAALLGSIGCLLLLRRRRA